MYATALCLLATLFCVSAQDTINIGFIYSGGGQYNTEGVQPAVNLAVELINNSTEVLQGYQLNITYTGDSQCDPAQSQRVFLTPELSERSGPDTLAIVGCGCSLATEPIAQISQYWNMIHMSYASSTDVLSDRSRYTNFWRTYPRESNLAGSVLAIMQQYSWSKLKIITQDELIFTSSTDVVYSQLNSSSINVLQDGTSLIDLDEGTNITAVFEPEVRIYMLNMYPALARRVLCAAARGKEGPVDQRFRYDKYIWITLGWYGENWWTVERLRDNSSYSACSDEDVEQFLQDSIAIFQANSADNDTKPTDVQLTADEFDHELDRRLREQNLPFEHSAFHAYDAVWSLALAMDRYITAGGDLSNYNRLNGDSTIQGVQSFLNSTFIGVSGVVEFDVNGTRVPDEPRVLKYRDNSVVNSCGQPGPDSIERVRVARVTGVDNTSSYEYYSCENDSTVWPDGIPVDGSPVNRTVPILLPLVIVYYTLAGIGIVFAIVCLLFNIIFRNRKIVKLISPNLNYVIAIGAIMLYAGIFFFVFPSLEEFWVTFACHIRLWLQGLGFSFTFGTIVMKLWRVYYIFSNPTVSKKKKSRIPKDWQLFLAACCLATVIGIILIFVNAIGKYKATLVQDSELPQTRDDDGNLLIYHNLVCEGPNNLIWIGVLYGILFLTLLFAVFLAFRTRKVQIKALNDYKYISAIAYISFVILVIMLVCAILLARFQNADAAVFSGLLFLFTTVALALTFIPKMVILYKDPKGENIFQRSMSQTGTILGGNLPETDDTRYLELEQHCKELEGRLAKCGEVVPTFRPRSETSFKLKSTSFSSIPPTSPIHRTTNTSFSAPTTPSHVVNPKTLNVGSSDYFTEGERSSTASSNDPKDLENGKA